jgi:hypothetical protein
MKNFVVCLVLVWLMATGCAHKLHPGSVSALDSDAYDALLAAESVIDDARAGLANHTLPGNIGNTLSAMTEAYNTAREAWLTYRGTVGVGTQADLDSHSDTLTASLQALTQAINAFNIARGKK